MPTFSHSSLTCFESCPLHYSFRYIQRLRPPDDRESIELYAGKRVHEALAFLYTCVMESKVPPVEQVLDVFKGNWKSLLHPGVYSAREGAEYSIDSYHSSGLKWITDYYRSQYPFDQESTEQIEWKLSIPLGEHGQYKLVGVIDRLSKAADGSYSIHDYKTSRTLPSQWQLESDRQLSLYEIGVRNEVEDSMPIRLVWHYLAFNKQLTLVRSREAEGNRRQGNQPGNNGAGRH